MAEINWNLLQIPNISGNALAAYDEGRKLRREDTARNALGVLVQNPNDQAAIGDLAQTDPGTAMQFRTQQATLARQQQEQKLKQTEQLSRLLNHARDEGTYQQALAAAKQIGIDTTGAPQNFDPAWVGQQKALLAAFDKDGGQQISGLARELEDAGYKQGTPEFAAAMRTALQGKYAPTYTDEQGNMRQGQLPPLPSAAPQESRIIPQRPPNMTDEQLFARAHEAVRNGANVEEVFRQLQAWGVNP